MGAVEAAARPVSAARRSLGTALAVALVLALVLALAGCASLLGRAPAREIAVELPVARAEAMRRTLAVFREQGYRVRETLTSASEPETEPFRHRDEAEAVFRAAISGTGRSSPPSMVGSRRLRPRS